MKRLEFLETRRGQSEAFTKRWVRRLRFGVGQQPQSKNIKTTDAINFQEQLAKKLDKEKRRPFRTPVFLKLSFYNSSKSPPSIYALPKNYLDLLERPRPDANIRRRRLVYLDDRQVEALDVRYHLFSPLPDGSPSVYIEADPLRCFREDVALTQRIERNNFREPGDLGLWGTRTTAEGREGPFSGESHDHFADDDEDYETLVDYARNENSWVRAVGREGYDAMLALTRRKVQQRHLRRTDRFTCRGLQLLFREPPGGSPTRVKVGDRFIVIPRRQVLAPPFVIDLPEAPQREGDTARFKVAVRSSLQKFREDYPFLFPLTALLNVTILMVPPEKGGKDLDNLARLVLPAVHEVFQPPSDLLRTVDVAAVKDPWLRTRFEEQLNELPKEPRYSITGYRAFTLPRYDDDPKQGFVRLAIGDGESPIDFRREIDDYLESWQRTVE